MAALAQDHGTASVKIKEVSTCPGSACMSDCYSVGCFAYIVNTMLMILNAAYILAIRCTLSYNHGSATEVSPSTNWFVHLDCVIECKRPGTWGREKDG